MATASKQRKLEHAAKDAVDNLQKKQPDNEKKYENDICPPPPKEYANTPSVQPPAHTGTTVSRICRSILQSLVRAQRYQSSSNVKSITSVASLLTPRGVEYGGLIRAWRSTCTAMTGGSRVVDVLMRLADIGASTREVAGVTVECREDDGVSTVGLPILPLGTGVGGCDLVEPGVGFAPCMSFNAPLACAPL